MTKTHPFPREACDVGVAAQLVRHVLPVAALMIGAWGGAIVTATDGSAQETLATDNLDAESALPVSGATGYRFVRDIDGDGQPDIANPTGHEVRAADAYGSGAFGASRAHGRRLHKGVDYVSEAGELVRAPITGTVTRLGYAYRGDLRFQYVEVTNERDGRTARILYVGPEVVDGQSVTAGDPIGVAQNLSLRYAAGITNHVHVEIADDHGRRLNADSILPRGEPEETQSSTRA